MAQLVERLVPTLEIRGLNLVNANLLTINCIKKLNKKTKTEKKEKKEAGNGPFL